MGAEHSQDIQYCYTVPNSRQAGFTPIYRNPLFKDALTHTPDPKIRTYRDVILTSFLDKYSNNLLAGKIVSKKKGQNEPQEKQIQSLTYKQCFQKAQSLGKAIVGHKLQFLQSTKQMKFIGIYSKNRVEWLLTDLACLLFGITSVPLYDTLGIQNLSYCLNQTQMTTLFLTADTLKVLIDLKDRGNLKNVVLFDRIDIQTVKKVNKLGLNVLDFQTLIQEGTKFKQISYKDVKVQPNDIYTFSYTSGTTGPPKGAMLSHLNFTSFLSAFNNHDLKFKGDDVHLSFLPLPHVFERLMFACLIFSGARIIFYSGDIMKVKDDCQIVRPTVFSAVPRLYNRIVQKIEQNFQQKTGISKFLINSAVESKAQNISNHGDFNSFIYDKLVFDKVKEAFGGRIRQLVSASAPLSKKNFEFMQMIMSCPLYEVYGQTQNTGAAFVRVLKDPLAGHVGGIVSNLQFRLCDIPEMKYTTEDKDQQGRPSPRGEIWLRGPGVIPGYYKLKDKTQQAITKDGWLKTGDVGVLSADGNRMRIIDRRKNIFKLQQGEYVAPQKVQNIYNKSHYVEEIFLHGQSTHSFCVAVVKPHKDHFLDLAKKNGIAGSYEQLCTSNQMRKIMIKELFNLGKSGGLNAFEQAKNIYLQSQPFVDKKILTNTMKLQRFQAKTVYKGIIEQLYTEGELPTK